MAKLTEADKRQITIQYAAGATCRELAEKFNVSPTAVSKILNSQKSLQKLTNVDEVYNAEKSSIKKKAHAAIKQIIGDLSEDLKKAPLRDKIATMEKLKDMFGLPEEEESEVITEIKVEVEDASGSED